MKKLLSFFVSGILALASLAACPTTAAAANPPVWVTDQTQQMPYSCLTTIWVDPLKGARGWLGGNGTKAHPYLLPEDINGNSTSNLSGGTCINLINDAVIYDQWYMYSTQRGSANTPTGYVVIRSTDSNGNLVPAVTAGGKVNTLPTGAGGPARWVACCNNFYSPALTPGGADYIILDGIDWSQEGISTNQNGAPCISVGESNKGPNTVGPSHILIRNNYVHGCGGGGIQANAVDFLIVQGNVCSGAATSNGYQESCFSSYQARAAKGFVPTGYDSQMTYHQVFADNIASDAYEAAFSPGNRTDGNCLIIDDNMNTQGAGAGGGQTNAGPYPYRTLVANNLLYHCGGKGVQTFTSQHVDILNNSLLRNNYDAGNNGTYRGEINLSQALDVRVFNNIVYTVGANTSVRVAGNGRAISVDDVSAYLFTNTGGAPSPSNTMPVKIAGVAAYVSGVSVDAANASTTLGGISGVLTFTTSVNGGLGAVITPTNTFTTPMANNSGLFDAGGGGVKTCAPWSATCSGSGLQTIATNSSTNFWQNNLAYAVNGAVPALVNGSSPAVPPTKTGGATGNLLGSNPLYTNANFKVSPSFALGGLALNSGGSRCALGERITLSGGSPNAAASIVVDSLSGTAISAFHIFNSGNYPSAGPTALALGSTTGTCAGASFKSATYLQTLPTVTPPVLTLSATSPALAAGGTALFPATNFLGNARPAGGKPNLGAY